MAQFSYVHDLGCTCSAPGYADRLRAARAALRAHREGEWDGAAAHIPDGSCLSWLRPGATWPSERRDYHLLALHAEVLRLREAEVLAWAEVEKARSANWGLAETKGRPVPYEAWRAAGDAAISTEEALRDAVAEASWGAQPDGSFVTRQALGIARAEQLHTLHAPGKGGPLVEVRDRVPHQSPFSIVALRTHAEARAIREAQRANARDAQEVYRAELRRVARALCANRFVISRPGQEGGTLSLPHRTPVSARGAVRLAESMGWVGEEVDVTLPCRSRARRLPARDARRTQVPA